MIGYAKQLVDYFEGNNKAAQSVPASLFFRKEEDNMGIVGLPFDLFISERHKLSFRTGDHPLQDGSVISDHVHQELQEVTIEGMFSNFSVNRPDRPTEPVEFKEGYGSVDESTDDVWLKEPLVKNTALKRLDELRNLAKSREPVRLVCSLDVYPKMIITDLSYDRDEKSGSSIRFTVSLREIVTVNLAKSKSSYAFSPKEIKSANDRLIASEIASGKRGTEEKDAAEMARLIKVEVAQ